MSVNTTKIGQMRGFLSTRVVNFEFRARAAQESEAQERLTVVSPKKQNSVYGSMIYAAVCFLLFWCGDYYFQTRCAWGLNGRGWMR